MEEINVANIVEIVGLVGVLVGIYNRIAVKMKEQEMKIAALEQQVKAFEQDKHTIYKKLDVITSMLTEIKIELIQKQDRE
jgi:Tfp pilus assembly protein PilN